MTRKQLVSRGMAVVAFSGLALGGAPVLAGPDGPSDAMRKDFAAVEAAAFTEADANGDGKLTPDEFANFHTIVRRKLDALRFSRLDTNGDGFVTKEELDAGRALGHGKFPRLRRR